MIRKIVRKRTQDGRERVVEVTKTVIQRDGSKSITRLDPQKYESKNNFHLDSNINLSNQAKQLVIPNSDVKMMGGHDAYNSNSANKKNGTAGGNGGQNSASSATLESHKSTTYQTTAYRSSSGAIVLNRIATTTTLSNPNLNAYNDQSGAAQEQPQHQS